MTDVVIQNTEFKIGFHRKNDPPWKKFSQVWVLKFDLKKIEDQKIEVKKI